MPHRHILTIDLAHGDLPLLLSEMRDDLVTVEIEVDPVRRGASFRASQKLTVKATRFRQVAYRECEMKSWNVHGPAF